MHLYEKFDQLKGFSKERRILLSSYPQALEPGFEIKQGYPGSVTLLTDDGQKFTILTSTEAWRKLSPRWQVKATDHEAIFLLRRNLATLEPQELELLRWYLETPPNVPWLVRCMTLVTINRVRKALGGESLNELRNGDDHGSSNDPLTRSLQDLLPGVRVGAAELWGVDAEQWEPIALALGTKALPSGYGHIVRLPQELIHFLCYFDSGLYPELIAVREE